MSFLADDDVVVHGNAERLCHLDDLLRHLDVGTGGGGIAGGVIVDDISDRLNRLETRVFLPCRKALGPWTRDGISILLAIITPKHARVGTVSLDNVRVKAVLMHANSVHANSRSSSRKLNAVRLTNCGVLRSREGLC